MFGRWRVARVRYDLEAVAEAALDNIRAVTEAARSSEAEEFVAAVAAAEDRPTADVRDHLQRHADYCLQQGRRELRQLARKAFEPMLRGTSADHRVHGRSGDGSNARLL